jgi:predicted dehydrogenase
MCELKIEGTQGAAIAKMGVNLNYPKGEPDTLEVALTNGEWTDVPLRGSWFLKAFEGPISNIQRFAAEEDATLVSDAADAIRTIALVEACYDSSARGATPIPSAD